LDTIQAGETRDAIGALGVHWVVVAVGEMASVAIFDSDSG
jgi:hypothetical protein